MQELCGSGPVALRCPDDEKVPHLHVRLGMGFTGGLVAMVPDPSADAELERFQLFVGRHLAPLPVTAPLPDAFGPWVSIVTTAAKAALALGSVRGGEAVMETSLRPLSKILRCFARNRLKQQ